MPLKSILLAEDDSNDVFFFWRFHKQCRIHNPVEVFSDGEDLITYFQRGFPPPAAVFLDLKLPRLDGLDVLAYLKTLEHQDFPKILLTGNQDAKLIHTAYQLGARSLLVKPFQKGDFCELMAKMEGIVMDGCVAEADLLSSAGEGLPQPSRGSPGAALAPWQIPPSPPHHGRLNLRR